jgi:hypothetical protein
LQEDSRRLHGLPRHRLGEEFTARVMRSVRQRGAAERGRRAAYEAALPLWTSAAAAAAVLIAVGFGSFFYFAHPAPDARPASVQTPPDAPPLDPTPALEERGKGAGPAMAENHAPPPKPPNAQQPPEELPMPEVAAKEGTKPAVNPEAVIGSETPQPDMEMFKPHVVKPPFMLVEEVRSLQAEKLRKTLGEEKALRVELPCNDTARGFRRLQAALKEVGVTLAIDAAAQNRLDKPRLRSNYVLFVEDLTAEDLARALAKVGAEDRKAAEAKPKPDGQFSKVVVNRLVEADLKELSSVLRVDAAQLQPGTGKGKGTERLALAVTYNPERPKANSPEVRRYLENRKPARPGAIQVLLVLREAPR